jgi:hypothetical protein
VYEGHRRSCIASRVVLASAARRWNLRHTVAEDRKPSGVWAIALIGAVLRPIDQKKIALSMCIFKELS